MWQERKNSFNSLEKFEDGVLRADACMKRYSTSRQAQYRTSFEDLPAYSFGHSALREERCLLNNVAKLISKGFKPQKDQSLEDFVQTHQDLLDEEVV